MKCNICDAALNEPKFNEALGNYDPCDFCMEVSEETLAGFIDQPSAAEDELGGPDPLELWGIPEPMNDNEDFT